MGVNPTPQGGDILTMPRELLDAVIDHARNGLPREVCGILGGSGSSASTYHPIANTEASSTRFLMDPREQIDTMHRLWQQGMEVLAFCHSHPAGPARPSTEDIRLAFYPEVLTVIISLEDRDNPTVGAFRITGGAAEPVRIEIAA